MTDGNKTNKTITDHEKRKNDEAYRDDRTERDRERSATEKERRVAEDVTDAPRQ